MKVEQSVVITISKKEFNALTDAKEVLLNMYDELNDQCLNDLDVTEYVIDGISCLRDVLSFVKVEP